MATVGDKFPRVSIQISRIPVPKKNNDKANDNQRKKPSAEGLEETLKTPRRSKLAAEEKLQKLCAQLSSERNKTIDTDFDPILENRRSRRKRPFKYTSDEKNFQPEDVGQKDADNRKKFYCPICKAGLQDTYHLGRHFVEHLELNPFVCKLPGCGQRSRDVLHLKRHLLGHKENPDVTSRLLSDIERLPSGQGSITRLVVNDPVYPQTLLYS